MILHPKSNASGFNTIMSKMSDSVTVDGGKVQVHGGFYLLAKRPPYYNKGVKKKNGFQERLEDLI